MSTWKWDNNQHDDWVLIWILLMLAVFVLIAALTDAVAHPDDVPFHDWLVSRQRPDRPGAPCCGAGPQSDQYFSDKYEPDPNVPGGYIAWITPHEGGASFAEPAHVPPDRVILDDVNPIGRGVIWISVDWPMSRGQPVAGVVFCFEPAAGT